jgi:hypothetical protein
VVGAIGLLVHWKTGDLTQFVASSQSRVGLAPGESFNLGRQLAMRAAIAGLVLLPLTCAFGASYSAAVASASAADARRAGRIYAVLTLGNIAGLGLAATLLLPRFGLDRGLLVVLAIAFATPLPALVGSSLSRAARAGTAVLLAGGAAFALFGMPAWSQRLLHSAAYAYATGDEPKVRQREVVVFHKTAFETAVTVMKAGDELYLQLDGKTTGSTQSDDQATQSMLGALPAALHEHLRHALVIGLGTGQTPAQVLRFPVERVDAAEISPEVADAMDFFRNINGDCRHDPRFRLLVADGRTVLRYGGEQYDLVVSEPSNVWIPGVAHLFTHERSSTSSPTPRSGSPTSRRPTSSWSDRRGRSRSTSPRSSGGSRRRASSTPTTGRARSTRRGCCARSSRGPTRSIDSRATRPSRATRGRCSNTRRSARS